MLKIVDEKKYQIFIVILFGIILLLFYQHFTTNDSYDVKIKKQLLNSYKIISNNKLVKDSEEKYVIDNGILKQNKKIYENKNMVGKGEFYSVNGEIFGQIEYEGYCLNKKNNSKIVNIKKGNCKLPITSKRASDYIVATASDKELINSRNSNDGNKTKDYSTELFYRGKNPDNYLIFSGVCWRILGVSNNETIKIIYEGPKGFDESCYNDNQFYGSVGLITWDKDKNTPGNWENKSTLAKDMLKWEEQSTILVGDTKIKLDINKIDSAEWNIGTVENINTDIEQIGVQEKSVKTKNNRKIGLPTVSDYIKAGYEGNDNYTEYSKDNFLNKDSFHWWLINPSTDKEKKVWIVKKSGGLQSKGVKFSNEFYFSGIRPVVYLKSDVILTGLGDSNNPYVIVK